MEPRRLSSSFVLYFFFLLPSTAIEPTTYYRAGSPYLSCMHNTTDVIALSNFKQNLQTAFLTLVTNQQEQGLKYANKSVGSGRDTAYAMFQCRGDQSVDLCWQCLINATSRLPNQDCPSSIGARIQLDGCYLRYDNYSFFTPDFSFAIGYCYLSNNDTNVLAAIAALVQNVTTQAPEQGGFASASAAGEYAMAQCLGYLNKSECSQCLSSVPYRSLCDSVLGEQVHLTSCYYRFEPYSFLDQQPAAPPLIDLGNSSKQPATPPLMDLGNSDAPAPRTKDSKSSLRVALGVGVPLSVAALCMWLLWRYNRTKRRQEDAEDGWGGVQPRAKVFLLQELEVATQHFHLHNKLGEGGFGPVYKGTLSNGKDIAIKRLSPRSHQGKKEFLNEVNLITSVQHKNLIKLIGSCVTRGERMLVYEYLPNKSLDVLLFVGEGTTLDWPVRYGIVLGLARGLAYLHEESQVRIIHRDIKPSNILLDDQLNPIISDFGLARLVQEEESIINSKIAGTLGYLAPEYAIHGELTEKVDVYSFGVLTLEVISGKRNLNARLLEWAWRLFLQGQHLELVDPRLSGVFSTEKARRMIQVALLCTQEVPRLRPSMSRVVSSLSEDFDISEVPTKPPFVEVDESNSSRGSSSSSFPGQHKPVLHASNAAQSISELEPR